MKNFRKQLQFLKYIVISSILLLIVFTFVFVAGGSAKTELVSMVKIPGGTFIMGSFEDEPGRYTTFLYGSRRVSEGVYRFDVNSGCTSDETQHSVKLSSFYMGKYQVTQEQYKTVMGYNPSGFEGDKRPVDNVTWYNAVLFCNQLSEKEGLRKVYTLTKVSREGRHISSATVTADWSKNGYRLPTEAEWEYACRGDYPNKATETKTKPFGIGDGTKMIQGMANFRSEYPWDLSRCTKYKKDDPEDESDCEVRAGCAGYEDSSATKYHKTMDVGSYEANNYGLYDMHGNIREWCWDWYGDYSVKAQTNPKGPDMPGPEKDNRYGRITRGGGWYEPGGRLRSAARSCFKPSYRSDAVGFRVVRNAK